MTPPLALGGLAEPAVRALTDALPVEGLSVAGVAMLVSFALYGHKARHAGRLASRAVRDVEVVAAVLVVLALVGWIDLRPDQAHAAVRWLAARLAGLAGGLPLPWP